MPDGHHGVGTSTNASVLEIRNWICRDAPDWDGVDNAPWWSWGHDSRGAGMAVDV